MNEQDKQRLAADTIRFLAVDAVQAAESGHPGTPMGLADTAVALWKHFLRHNPTDPDWFNRDRFILSAGHASMLLYSLLHLTGYDLPLNEIKDFRQWGSMTPGHPEHEMTSGVETTTGPLGQGISNAVGFALAEAWLAAQFNRPEYAIVDHYTYVIASDGDIQEGISHESCALAAHLGLGKLIVLYDDNHIQIDGDTDLAFSEDVAKRFEAYGWHTIDEVDGHDPDAVEDAIRTARAVTDRPSLIAVRTTIGYGSPNKAGTAAAHGSPLGPDEVVRAKEALDWPTEKTFYVPDEAADWMDARTAGEADQTAWEELYATYAEEYPEEAARFDAMIHGELPDGWRDELPTFEEGGKLATRAASGQVLDKLVPAIPQLIGGSADLTGSNKTYVKGTKVISADDVGGRYIHYGVREHGMAAIMNGMALHGGVLPYGGTFLIFSDYMRGGMRLSALMEQQVIYVLTHDSIGLGEDGPTHQPIAHLMALRAIPNMHVIRPADASETAAAWQMALEHTHGPTVLALTRQKLPTMAATDTADALKGAYAINASEDDEAIIIATGSEVEIALAAQGQLAEDGVSVRVVSMPSWERFAQQSADYQETVLPDHIDARVSIEAGATLGWERYIGRKGIAIGLDRFGASAPYETIYEELGLTADAVVAAVQKLVE